jgi:Spore Coat Protein U domain
VLTANVDQTSTIQVQCTNTTAYNIGLDAGTASGATVTTRKMTSGGTTVSYSLYSNSGRITNWGNTVGTDTVSSTGTGASQSFTLGGVRRTGDVNRNRRAVIGHDQDLAALPHAQAMIRFSEKHRPVYFRTVLSRWNGTMQEKLRQSQESTSS